MSKPTDDGELGVPPLHSGFITPLTHFRMLKIIATLTVAAVAFAMPVPEATSTDFAAWKEWKQRC